MEVLVFIAGAFFGASGMFILFFWLGTSERFKKYDVGPDGQVYYHKPEPCKDGHKWCEQHAAQGKFHCTVCTYTMEQ